MERKTKQNEKKNLFENIRIVCFWDDIKINMWKKIVWNHLLENDFNANLTCKVINRRIIILSVTLLTNKQINKWIVVVIMGWFNYCNCVMWINLYINNNNIAYIRQYICEFVNCEITREKQI